MRSESGAGVYNVSVIHVVPDRDDERLEGHKCGLGTVFLKYIPGLWWIIYFNQLLDIVI